FESGQRLLVRVVGGSQDVGHVGRVNSKRPEPGVQSRAEEAGLGLELSSRPPKSLPCDVSNRVEALLGCHRLRVSRFVQLNGDEATGATVRGVDRHHGMRRRTGSSEEVQDYSLLVRDRYCIDPRREDTNVLRVVEVLAAE